MKESTLAKITASVAAAKGMAQKAPANSPNPEWTESEMRSIDEWIIQTYQSSPIGLSGRPAHCPFRGLLGVHSRCGLHTRAVTNLRHANRRLQPLRYLHDCSDCFRLERLPGGACTHWKAPPLHGAHPQRTCGLRAACRVLLPAWLHLIIVLAAAPTRIASLGIPIGLEKRPVAPEVAARNGDISRRPARHKAALGLVVQHRDELGAMVGLAAQRLVRDS